MSAREAQVLLYVELTHSDERYHGEALESGR
jgi:hypothetical protein